jgi:hypothetical protein
MKTTIATIALASLLAAAPAQGSMAPGPQDDEPGEVEGPPGPPTPEEPDTGEPEQPPAEEGAAPDSAATEEEVEGPTAEQAPAEPDMIIGLEPGGMPVVPDEPTKYGTDDVRRGLFLIGGGIGIGIFMPRDVNKYLDDWPRRQVGLAVEQAGFSEMVINYVPRVTVTYIPIEYVQLQILGEIGWSPKAMTFTGGGGEDDTEWFHYVRYSPGALANFHLPVNSNKQSIFVGGGVLYHWLRFEGGGEDYKAETLGYRAQIGYRFYIRAFVPEVFVAFDYVKGETGKAIPDTQREMTLEYTGGMVGGNFYFDLTTAVGAS